LELREFVEEGGFWDEPIRLEVGGLNIFLLDRFRPKADCHYKRLNQCKKVKQSVEVFKICGLFAFDFVRLRGVRSGYLAQ
jgi:hypothetical protein